jgi:hypothetical protein
LSPLNALADKLASLVDEARATPGAAYHAKALAGTLGHLKATIRRAGDQPAAAAAPPPAEDPPAAAAETPSAPPAELPAEPAIAAADPAPVAAKRPVVVKAATK